MTINFDTEIAATRFDPAEGACYYTLLRDGKRYTAKVMVADLDKFGGNKAARRNFVSGALETRLMQPADPEPTPPTPVAPPPPAPAPPPPVAAPPPPAPSPPPEAPAASQDQNPPYRPW